MIIENNVVAINYQPSGGKSWIAKIMGKHPKYKYERKFISPDKKNHSSSGKTGMDYYKITEDGYYEINEAWKKNRQYIHVLNGHIEEIDPLNIII